MSADSSQKTSKAGEFQSLAEGACIGAAANPVHGSLAVSRTVQSNIEHGLMITVHPAAGGGELLLLQAAPSLQLFARVFVSPTCECR